MAKVAVTLPVVLFRLNQEAVIVVEPALVRVTEVGCTVTGGGGREKLEFSTMTNVTLDPRAPPAGVTLVMPFAAVESVVQTWSSPTLVPSEFTDFTLHW